MTGFLAEMAAAVRARVPPARPFAPGPFGVIAEIKPVSPAEGRLLPSEPGFSHARALARAYVDGGAAAISVLVEPTRFGGSLALLAAIRAGSPVPVLAKDFVLDPAQIAAYRGVGADGVLLVAGFAPLGPLVAAARAHGMFALIEAFDAETLALARPFAGPGVHLGLNARDLRTLGVDPLRHLALAGSAEVAESGVRGPRDAAALARAGYTAALVGTSLLRAADPAAAVRALTTAGVTAARKPGIFVKICGLSDAAGVDAAVAAGADAVGVVLARSRRQVDARAAAGLLAQVPPGILRVAVVDDAVPPEAHGDLGADVVQGEPEVLARCSGVARLVALRDGPDLDPAGAALVVLDGPGGGGRGVPADWTRAASLARKTAVILAGGLTPSNVAAAVAAVRPRGVDVSSGVESEPGRKDPRKIAEFVAAARRVEVP